MVPRVGDGTHPFRSTPNNPYESAYLIYTPEVHLYNPYVCFIECFTTTFLRTHSWLNWVDEDDDEHDEVGLKEKPEDTRYIKKITSK